MKRLKKSLMIFIITGLFLLTQLNIFADTTQGNEGNTNQAQENENLQNVESDETQVAIDALMALGIVNGKEDGQYHPEQNITREEFTKIIVEMLGFGEVTAITSKETNFTDVSPDNWSAPYINIAVNNKLVNGYENNLFKPKENVTLGQAVTIILRGLGYKDEYLSGNWPYNYISKADEEGILDDINLKHDSVINRGIVALMIYRTLDLKPLEVSISGDTFSKADSTLLEMKRNITKFQDVFIMSKEKEKDEDAVKIKFTKDTYHDRKLLKKDDTETFKIREAANVNLVVGTNVTILIDEDDYIFYQEKDDIEKEVDNNILKDEFIINSYVEKPIGKVRLSQSKSYLDIAKDAEIYVDGKKIEDEEDYEEYLNDKIFGTFVVDGESITYGVLNTWEYESLLVKEVDIDKKIFECAHTIKEGTRYISMDKMKIGTNIYLIEGENTRKINFSEILKGDIINITNENENIEEASLYVWRNKDTGKFEKIFGGVNGQNISFTLQGNETKYDFADAFSYSYDGGGKITSVKDEVSNTINRLSDFYNEQVTVSRNWRDEIVYLEGSLSIKIDQYGVLTYFYDSSEKIRIYTQTGSKTTYSFEDDDEYYRIKENIPEGSIIKYSIGKSGELKNFSDSIENDFIKVNQLKKIRAEDDFGLDYALINGKKYTVDSNTVIFDYTTHDDDDVEKITWKNLQEREVTEDVEVIIDEDDGVLKLLTIWENIEGIKANTDLGYIVANYQLGSNRYVEVYSYGSASKVKYKLDEDSDENIFLGGRLGIYNITASNQLEAVEDEDLSFTSGEIEEIVKNRIKVGDSYYHIYSDTEVFKGNNKMSIEDIEENDLIAMYAEDIDEAKMIKVIESEFADEFGEGTLKSVDSDSEEPLVIEIDGETRSFTVDPNIDYVFRDGYLNTSDSQLTFTERLEEKLGSEEPTVKFIYDEYTDEIYEMIVDMNVND